MPFVLHSQPTGVFEAKGSIGDMATESHRRYAEIMKDVEDMIDDHSASSFGPAPIALLTLPQSTTKKPASRCKVN